jgi:hypothetical protein
MSTRLAALVIAALVFAGCSISGAPQKYPVSRTGAATAQTAQDQAACEQQAQDAKGMGWLSGFIGYQVAKSDYEMGYVTCMKAKGYTVQGVDP